VPCGLLIGLLRPLALPVRRRPERVPPSAMCWEGAGRPRHRQPRAGATRGVGAK